MMKRSVSKESVHSQQSACSEASAGQSETDNGAATSALTPATAGGAASSSSFASGFSLINRVRKSMSRDAALAQSAAQAVSNSGAAAEKQAPAAAQRSVSAVEDVVKAPGSASDDRFFNVSI